jgi:hypothetical protein
VAEWVESGVARKFVVVVVESVVVVVDSACGENGAVVVAVVDLNVVDVVVPPRSPLLYLSSPPAP